MTTPNTTGPSASPWKRYTFHSIPDSQSEDGRWVEHSAALAALSRARDEARRAALEALKLTVDTLPCMPLDGYPEESRVAFRTGWEECGNCIADNIEALLTPTPQGEKEKS